MMAHPTDVVFTEMVRNKVLKNSPVKPSHAANAGSLFGSELSGGRGRQTRVKPGRVEVGESYIPRDFYVLNHFVTITADIMFVNGIAFLITFSRKVRLLTVEHVVTRTAESLTQSINKIINIYSRGGFTINAVLMDMEFEKNADKVALAEINTTAAREHVGEIERQIRLVKERTRATTSVLPFKSLHRQLTIHLVYFSVFWLNAIPNKKGISEHYSPREIVTHKEVDHNLHCRVEFGAYVEAHDDPVITNDMVSRTRPSIALGPAGNRQGSIKVFCLTTGMVLKRRNFTEYPMPDKVITKVNQWGSRTKREQFGMKTQFLNRKQKAFDWDNEDSEEEDNLIEQVITHPEIPAEFPGVELEEEQVQDLIIDITEATEAEEATAAAINANIDTPIYVIDEEATHLPDVLT